MNTLNCRLFILLILATAASSVQAQTTNIYTTASTFIVPAGVSSVSIKAWGGAGGTGGQDCGAGCTNAAAGPVGYTVASFTATSGFVIGIYPGGQGGNGNNAATGNGAGAGGTDTYPSANYNGGAGGNAGPTGSSGAGGGGGAATVVTINGTVRVVAGGAGGGGGMANQANSGLAGSATTSALAVTNGGAGTSPSGDGGAGGGGGGGQFASAGGSTHAAGSESAGDGGFRGGNSLITPLATTTNGTIAWTSSGRVEITYTATLPLTWVSFTASREGTKVHLAWTTASEQNTRDFVIERSADGATWESFAEVAASGNSATDRSYVYTDEHALAGLAYYRLMQRDLDGRFTYSRVVIVESSPTGASMQVYPNPVTNGRLTISLSGSATIGIYNGAGLRLISKHLPAGVTVLDVAALHSGTYLIKSSTGLSAKLLIR